MSADLYQSFGRAVATRRNAQKMTQHNLAAAVGISRASIANIERGRQNVLLHHVYAIASALKIGSVGDLLPVIPTQRPPTRAKLELMIEMNADEGLSDDARGRVTDVVASLMEAGQKAARSR